MSKKAIMSVVSSVVLLVSQVTYAADVAKFVIEVNPAKSSVNQAVDLTVKAVDNNNNVVKDYVGTVWMFSPEVSDLQDAVLPWDGVYTFAASDQWQKTFSKWLNIKIPGSFTIEVSDENNSEVRWETSLIVEAWSTNTQPKNTITFSSPIQNGTETSSTISVVGNAWVKNAKVQILLNGTKVKEESSNQNGDFTAFLTALQPGQYILKAVVKDINDALLAESADLTFTYQPTQAGDIQSFDVLPSKTLKQWQKATFVVRVGGKTTSVEITLRDEAGKEQKLPLDKMPDGTFQKQLLMDVAGTYTIDAAYNAGASAKTQANVASVSVIEWLWIKEVTYIVDPLDKTKLSVGWKPIGAVQNVLVQKGKTKESLDEGTLFTAASFQLIAFDVSKESYYIRLFPADAQGKIVGEPSDFIMIEQVQGSAPVCRVQGIEVINEKVGDQYFLTWKPAENAERYIVYRSDRPVNSVADMQKVGETSDTKFPYPFDPQAKTESYAYYAVVAMCQDGTSLQLGWTQKVKVWPATNMMILLLISMMIFGIYRMRKVSN
jgi:uncharacterized protein YfaT (DUF1175 family)